MIVSINITQNNLYLIKVKLTLISRNIPYCILQIFDLHSWTWGEKRMNYLWLFIFSEQFAYMGPWSPPAPQILRHRSRSAQLHQRIFLLALRLAHDAQTPWRYCERKNYRPFRSRGRSDCKVPRKVSYLIDYERDQMIGCHLFLSSRRPTLR